MPAPLPRPLRVHLLRPELACLPSYATSGAAGLDLSAALEEPLEIPVGGRALVPTGLAIALPAGHEGQVRPRSGLAARRGVTVLNAPGTIDEDYRGELKVILINLGDEPHRVMPKDRVAQLVIAPVARVCVEACHSLDELGTTTRDEGGFGSTGGF